MNDTFVHWILGISATVVVGVGGALITTLWRLAQEVTKISTEMKALNHSVELTCGNIQIQVSDHEQRIRSIEQSD